jgi:hypothetical protein
MSTQLLLTIAAALAGFWLRHWTGPVATWLRERLGNGAKLPAINPDTLIPDDPNSVLDDALRALLKAILAANATAPAEDKLGMLQRILDLFRERLEPRAIKSR